MAILDYQTPERARRTRWGRRYCAGAICFAVTYFVVCVMLCVVGTGRPDTSWVVWILVFPFRDFTLFDSLGIRGGHLFGQLTALLTNGAITGLLAVGSLHAISKVRKHSHSK
jgi:hypothetical protein